MGAPPGRVSRGRRREVMRARGRAPRRPTRLGGPPAGSRAPWLPGWSLRLAVGGVAVDALESIRARPDRLVDVGFRFEHGTIAAALEPLRAR